MVAWALYSGQLSLSASTVCEIALLWGVIPRWQHYFVGIEKLRKWGLARGPRQEGNVLCGYLLPLILFSSPFSLPSPLLPFFLSFLLLLLVLSFFSPPLSFSHFHPPLFSPFLPTFCLFFIFLISWITTTSTLAQKLTENTEYCRRSWSAQAAR